MKLTHIDYNKTVRAHPERLHENKTRWIVDATGKTLGRLAVEIAKKLQGKHRAWYADHHDVGDYVIVLNADKITVTGNKMNQKMYYKHTGYKGHLREKTLKQMMTSKPLRVLEYAVRGMLPKNKQRKVRMSRLKLFMGSDHPYAAQNPVPLNG